MENTSESTTYAIFSRMFDVECLLNSTDDAAFDDAHQFVGDHLRDMRVDATIIAAFYFTCLVVSMEMVSVPDPTSDGASPLSKILFFIWFNLQILLILSQALGILLLILAYMCMSSQFGNCLKTFMGGGLADLTLVTILCGVWMPSLLQKLLAIEVALMSTVRGCRAVKLERAGAAASYIKAIFDSVFATCAALSLIAWAATFAWIFALPLILIPVVMLTVTGLTVLGVYGFCWGIQSGRNCFCQRCLKKNEQEKDTGSWVAAVKWAESFPKTRKEMKTVFSLARTEVPCFAFVALIAMALAPTVVFSTWWMLQIYSWSHLSSETAKMLSELYAFSLASWTNGLEMPSLLSLSELLEAMTLENIEETLMELGTFELTLPAILLKRSRMMSLLSLPISVAKTFISNVDWLLEFGSGQTDLLQTQKLSNGASAENLRKSGKRISEVRLAGYSDGDIAKAGFAPEELAAKGFTVNNLKEAGIPEAELRLTGKYSDGELKEAFRPVEPMRAGSSMEESGPRDHLQRKSLPAELAPSALPASEPGRRSCPQAFPISPQPKRTWRSQSASLARSGDASLQRPIQVGRPTVLDRE